MQFARIGILRQSKQTWPFAFEGFSHGNGGLFAARAIRGRTAAPDRSLSIKVVEVDELTRSKEVLAYVPDSAFDATLLVVMASRP